MDNITSKIRHNNMSRIRSIETKPERQVRSALFALGFRFRKNDRRYKGSPDIVLPHYHAVIFVNGCFWHGHTFGKSKSLKCEKFKLPKTNTEFWRSKIQRNLERDAEDVIVLQKELWRVGVVWECSITGRNRSAKIRKTAEEISLWLEEGFDEPYKEF